MMRVLFVGQSYIASESRKKLRCLARHLDCVVSLIVPATWKHETFGCYTFQPDTTDDSLAIFPVPIHNNGRVFAFYYEPRAIWRIAQKIQPDVMHIEQEPGSLALLQFVALAVLRPKTKLLAFTWENLLYRPSAIRQVFERIELSRLDFLFVGSQTSADVFRAKGYRGSLATLPNVGIDPDHFRPRPRSADARFVTGFVGRLVPEKGCLDLLDAFTKMPEQGELLFVGNGILREELARVAQERGVATRVTFQPTVPHAQVAEFMNRMDCLVLPSHTTPQWREQFGLVLAQAMACGVPVIGSDSGAIPEVIGDAGLIFPEGNVNALRDCLARLRANPGLRAELSARGRARVLTHYTNEHIAEQTYAIYQELLKRR